MGDHIASNSSDTTNDTVASIAASKEPTNHSPAAAEYTHQMSSDSEATSGGLDQTPDGAAIDAVKSRINVSQTICKSTTGERPAQDGGAELENGLDWTPDQKSVHESSRSSSPNSDRQKVNTL